MSDNPKKIALCRTAWAAYRDAVGGLCAKRLHLGAGGVEYDCDPGDKQSWLDEPGEL